MEPRPGGTREAPGIAADEPFHPPDVVRVGGRAPFGQRWVAVAAALLAILIIKPWGGDTGGSGIRSTPSSPPVPTPPRTSERPQSSNEVVAAECQAPSGWRVFTIERWHEETMRIWWAVTPVVTTEPTDPRIPVLSIVATDVPALGYCAPLFGPDRPPADAVVRMWRVDSSGSLSEIRAPRLQPPFDTPLLALYAPPSPAGASPDPTGTWSTGRYLFSSDDLWFGVDLRIDAPHGPLATPGPSDAPSPRGATSGSIQR